MNLKLLQFSFTGATPVNVCFSISPSYLLDNLQIQFGLFFFLVEPTFTWGWGFEPVGHQDMIDMA